MWRVRWAILLMMAEETEAGHDVNVQALGAWAAEARVLAEADEARCREERRNSWINFAILAVKEGGKKAHRWLKGPQSWHPEHAGEAEDPQYGPQEIADQCMEWWSAIWGSLGVGGGGDEGDEGPSREVASMLELRAWESPEAPEITKGMVKEAAGQFKHHTAKGFCGWHPRAWNQLPEDGLQATANLIMLIEQARCWPADFSNIDLVRLQKEGGGHRLIGLLPSLYRLWGKIRRSLCVDWEAQHKDESDFAVAGQSAQRAAWDFGIENEACQESNGLTVAWQGDLEKCYELVPFSVILKEAEAVKFPAKERCS